MLKDRSDFIFWYHFTDRRSELSFVVDFDPNKTFGAVLFYEINELVDLRSRKIFPLLESESFDRALLRQDIIEHFEARADGVGAEIFELQTKTQIGLVVSETVHRIVKRHTWDRTDVDAAEFLPQELRHFLVHIHDVVLIDETHLHIDLRKFGLTIGP